MTCVYGPVTFSYTYGVNGAGGDAGPQGVDGDAAPTTSGNGRTNGHLVYQYICTCNDRSCQSTDPFTFLTKTHALGSQLSDGSESAELLCDHLRSMARQGTFLSFGSVCSLYNGVKLKMRCECCAPLRTILIFYFRLGLSITKAVYTGGERVRYI